MFYICLLDAIVQNEILPFGSQRKKRKFSVENKMQFDWGFIDEKNTSIRLVCSCVIKQSCLGNFRFRKLNTICRPGNYMLFNIHFIGKKTNQSVVCDSRSNFGFSKLNTIWRPGYLMQFGWGFIGKNKTFAKDKCAEGKSGDDI